MFRRATATTHWMVRRGQPGRETHRERNGPDFYADFLIHFPGRGTLAYGASAPLPVEKTLVAQRRSQA